MKCALYTRFDFAQPLDAYPKHPKRGRGRKAARSRATRSGRGAFKANPQGCFGGAVEYAAGVSGYVHHRALCGHVYKRVTRKRFPLHKLYGPAIPRELPRDAFYSTARPAGQVPQSRIGPHPRPISGGSFPAPPGVRPRGGPKSRQREARETELTRLTG